MVLQLVCILCNKYFRTMAARGIGTPEYKAISSNRQELEAQLSTCLEDVAGSLRDKEILTVARHKKIISNDDAPMLVDDMLKFIKTCPVDCFVEFMTALKEGGSKYTRQFVQTTVEASRKQFYRDLLKAQFGLSSQTCDVFISSSRGPDSNPTVELIDTKLTQSGLKVFVDSRSIQPGDIWPAEIVSAIHSCKAFVAVLTKSYVRSHYCNGELYEAEALGKRLFPVICERGWEEAPGGQLVLGVIAGVQPSTVESEENIVRLVESIRGTTASESPALLQSTSQPTEQADGPATLPDISRGAGSIETWRQSLGSKLDRSIDYNRQDIIIIAGLFDSVEHYLDMFELLPGEKHDVRSCAQLSGTQVAMSKALTLWMNHKAIEGVTFGTLLDILLRLKKESIAINLCKFLSEQS